jgi:hypothetical protein
MLQSSVRFLAEVVAVRDAIIRTHVEERIRQGFMVRPKPARRHLVCDLEALPPWGVSSHLRTATRISSSVKGNSLSSSSSIWNNLSVAMNRCAARALAVLRAVVFKDRYISLWPRRTWKGAGTRRRKKKESASRRRKFDAAKGTLRGGAAWGYFQHWRHEAKLLNYNKESGWGTWIRTRTNGVRVRGSTVNLFPNAA